MGAEGRLVPSPVNPPADTKAEQIFVEMRGHAATARFLRLRDVRIDLASDISIFVGASLTGLEGSYAEGI